MGNVFAKLTINRANTCIGFFFKTIEIILIKMNAMNFMDYQKRLFYLLDLIKKDCVHSPKQLAKQFSCNEKTVRDMINVLREKGYEIVYSRSVKKHVLKK